MPDLTPEALAELRRLLDDMRRLALREGVYNGNRAVLSIIERVEPLLDEMEGARAKLDAVRGAVDCHVPARDGSIYMDARELLAALDGTDES